MINNVDVLNFEIINRVVNRFNNSLIISKNDNRLFVYLFIYFFFFFLFIMIFLHINEKHDNFRADIVKHDKSYC